MINFKIVIDVGTENTLSNHFQNLHNFHVSCELLKVLKESDKFF